MIIYGYPSTGKTHLQFLLKTTGVTKVLESDDFIQERFPDYFKKKLYEKPSQRKKMHLLIANYVKDNFNKFAKSINNHFITNIHPASVFPKIKADYAFYHSKFDPSEEEKEKKKWTNEFIKKLEGWNQDAISPNSVEKKFADNFIIMPKNKHISDYFEIDLGNLSFKR